MDPPDVAGIADARLSYPTVWSHWFYTNLTFLPLFDTVLKSRFLVSPPPFLTHWLRKGMQCDLENLLLAAMEKENPFAGVPMTNVAHCDDSGPEGYQVKQNIHISTHTPLSGQR